jgi:predicted DNA-binding mobile mystery protein A
MSVKTTARQQYQRIVDKAARSWTNLVQSPPEGWLRTVRNALGMSAAQLAEKMGVTRARIAQAEHAELSGSITLKTMEAMAKAMGCRFVYAVIPEGRIEDIILAQARKKATTLVGTASKHMALEDQTLPNERITERVERLTREIAREMPRNFWSDNDQGHGVSGRRDAAGSE